MSVHVVLPEDAQNAEQDDTYSRLMESVLRITCAGFAGACVGLSYSNKASGAKIFQRAVVVGGTKKRPPRAVPKLKTVQQGGETNYPLMYATSFMAFVSILETSRFWSPSSLTMNLYQKYLKEQQQQDEINLEEEETHNFNSLDLTAWPQFSQDLPGGPKSLATILDCTLGGTVAGLAGGLSKQRPPPTSSSTNRLELPSAILKSGRRSILLSSIGTGFALGVLAGVCQAGLDVAETYAVEEEARQKEMEAIREEQIKREQEERERNSSSEEQK